MNRDMHTTRAYATTEDFCSVFQEELASLYQLAFLLTADHQVAEQVFVAALEECVNGNPVFNEWARIWARRLIIARAIRAVAPASSQTGSTTITNSLSIQSPTNVATVITQRLAPFDRFAFVMAVLEGLPAAECAALLGCKGIDVVQARTRAMQALASAAEMSRTNQEHVPNTLAAEYF